MTHRHPPRTAAWLLDCFVGQNQALIGDIAEEYRTGHSRLWFWRQTVMAAVRSTLGEIRSHWILALRAVIFFQVFWLCYNYCIARPFAELYTDILWNVDPNLVSSRGLSFGAVLLRDFPYALLPCLGLVIGSRIVARLHRPYQAAFALMNASVVFAIGTVPIVIRMLQIFHYVENHQRGKPHPGYFFWIYNDFGVWAIFLVLYAVSTFAGGLWNRPPAADSV